MDVTASVTIMVDGEAWEVEIDMLPSLPVMIRVPATLVPRWRALRDLYKGVPQSMLLRLVVRRFLEQDIEAQCEAVDSMIRGGGDGPPRGRSR